MKKGQPHTPETRQKMREAQKRRHEQRKQQQPKPVT